MSQSGTVCEGKSMCFYNQSVGGASICVASAVMWLKKENRRFCEARG